MELPVVKCEWHKDGNFNVIDTPLEPRSLLFKKVDASGNVTYYNVAAKCRNTSPNAVKRAVLRAVLSAKRTKYIYDNKPEALRVGRTVKDWSAQMLGAQRVAVVDNNGHVVPGSWVEPLCGRPLRDEFNVPKSKNLYKYAVTEGLAWNDEKLVSELNSWLEAMDVQWNYTSDAVIAIDQAGDANAADHEAEQLSEAEPVAEAEAA